jgi:hypothetical protein
MVLSKMTLAAFAIGAAAFTTPVSSAPLAPPSKGSAWGCSFIITTTGTVTIAKANPVAGFFSSSASSSADRHGYGHGRAHLLYGVPFSYGSYDNATNATG